MIFDIDAQIIINGLDISRFVISYTRNHIICNVMQTGEITCTLDLKDFIDRNALEDILPYQDIEIWELGVKVLTGFVTTVNPKRTPAPLLSIGFNDKYKRAKDYFIDEPDWNTVVQPLPTIVEEILNLAGLDMVLISPGLSSIMIPSGEAISLTSASDFVEQIVAYGNAVIYAGGDGVIRLQKGSTASSLEFTTGLLGSGVNFCNVSSASYEISDENSRDIVKVWGQKPYWQHLEEGESPFIVAERTVDLDLPVRKTMLYSSSIIQTQTEADRLADEIISTVGLENETYRVECQGNPNITVSKLVRLNLNLESQTISGRAKITSVKTNVSENGYTMGVTFNEFCPKFAGWALLPQVFPLYAGTTQHGIFKSVDGGITWTDFNAGLPSGIKYVKKMAYNSLDEGMSIVNSQVYFSDGVSWSHCTLPAPVNSALDSPAPTYSVPVGVDSISAGEFYVLTTNSLEYALPSGETNLRNRTWLYRSSEGGLISANWTSEAVHDDTDYNYYGVDVNSRNGFPYILTKAFTDPNFYLSNMSLKISGSNYIGRGTNIAGNIGLTSYHVEPDLEYGIVPVGRNRESSRIIRIFQSSPYYLATGLIDPLWPSLDVTCRLVFGYNSVNDPGYNPINPYFRPFIGHVVGRAGYHAGGEGDPSCTGASYFGSYSLIYADVIKGYKDYTITFNKNTFPYKNYFGGFDVCFYLGSSVIIGGRVSSGVYFNGESNRFSHLQFPLDHGSYPAEFWYLDAGFNGYAFNLANLSVNW